MTVAAAREVTVPEALAAAAAEAAAFQRLFGRWLKVFLCIDKISDLQNFHFEPHLYPKSLLEFIQYHDYMKTAFTAEL